MMAMIMLMRVIQLYVCMWTIYNHSTSMTHDNLLARSLNFLPSHSRSLKVIQNDTLEKRVKSLLVCQYNCLYLVPFLRYSALNNDVTLKTGLGVVQGHSTVR